MKKPQLSEKEACELMGKIVTVTIALERTHSYHHDHTDAVWLSYKLAKPRAGWVVGVRTRYNGQLENLYGGGTVWKPGKPIRILLVAFWPSTKPVSVPLDGFFLGGEPSPLHRAWPQRWKDIQAEEMAKVPRDAKGRWLPTA